MVLKPCKLRNISTDLRKTNLHIDVSYAFLLPYITAKELDRKKNHFFPQGDEQLLLTVIRKRTKWYEKGRSLFEMSSLSDCIPWMTVGLVESIAIVTLNLCMIVVFIRNRNLRKRSTYLVINLTAVDMFVGGSVIYSLFYWSGIRCNLWKWHSIEDGTKTFIEVLMVLFPVASLTNISVIALERVHATFFPFRHRVLKKWVLQLIITVVWVFSGLLATADRLLLKFKETHYYGASVLPTASLIYLMIICSSCTSVVIKVRYKAQPHHGAVSRERKLTMTLLIVSAVSLLLYLPHVFWISVGYFSKYEIWWSLPPSLFWHLDNAFLFLLYANSLVNPILYAIRLPEYRSGVYALFRERPQQQRLLVPLRDM